MLNAKTGYQENVINKIKKLRLEKNISQNHISEILQISPGLVGNIESYKYPHKYTIKQLYLLAVYFNCKIEVFFFDEFELKGNNIDINQFAKKIIEYDDK